MTDYSTVSRSTGLILHAEDPRDPFRHLNAVIMPALSSPDETPLLPSTLHHLTGLTLLTILTAFLWTCVTSP